MGKILRNKALSGFMLGHFTNDMFMGVLTALLPILKSEFHLSNAQIGLIALVQAGSGSLFQPIFGLLADRFRIRFFVPAIIFEPDFRDVWLIAGICVALGFMALLAASESYDQSSLRDDLAAGR